MTDVNPTVNTTGGLVEGERLPSGVAMFRGVPFTGPVGGIHRFRSAARLQPWEGVLKADEWPHPVPQLPDPNDTANAHHFDVYVKRPQSEGPLSLNLWTRSLDPGSRQPVIVWLHGGGFVTGEPTRGREDGRHLAERGVVVVSPTHRLGVLGYLNLYHATDGDYPAASPGLDDLVRSLEWVQENIVHFGGDPGNITIMGESGGAAKVHTLMGSPRARNLFRNAVLLAGANSPHSVLDVDTLDVAADRACEYLEILGLNVGELDSIAELPIERLLAADGQFSKRHPMGWRPTVDGTLLPKAPWQSTHDGDAAHIPTIVGSSRYELDVFGTGAFGAIVSGPLGEAHEQLVKHYRATRPNEHEAQIAFLTDAMFRMPGIQLAEDQAATGSRNIYQYVFDYEYDNPRWPDFRATHGSETAFIFDRTDSPEITRDDEAAAELATHVSDAFAQFARTGVPGFPGMGGGTWPAYDLDRRATAVIGRQTRIDEDPDADDRRVWSRLLPRSN